MSHPVLRGSGNKVYLLVWVLMVFLHGTVLYFYYGWSLEISAADSLVYNLLFASIAPGFWYIVTFASLSKDDLALVGTHLAGATMAIFLWAALSGVALRFLFPDHQEYMAFLKRAYIWRLIIGVMYYSITVLVFYLIKYYQDLQERTHRELELQNLLKDSELRMLKSQINPHFIFNSLNSVSALTVSKPEAAREMVIKLSDFLRYSLGKDSVHMNTLAQELDNATLYMDIEKIRFGSRLRFEKEVDDACLKVNVPNLILQPIFENAIKYGVHESIHEVTIRLKCVGHPGMLEIHIGNNFDEESMPSKGAGIGLENVRRRLGLVYGRNDLLEVDQQDGEFMVKIKIPTENE
ncbi:sensor histidine kinase [Marinoscillum sp. 108]|uniref:sensor histidine kinase n=1 Tax=Marinoscillum sp. 108 TaxID=2653151 RepID=UPI0012F43A7A|nr:histidine kinase [Marinoscillum sp. 108]VXD10521.1 Histidine kinase [Marinoscillum sp. 108]